MNESPREREEKAAIRRRWITLGELLTIAAVAISALTLWNSYKERATSEAERTTEAKKAETRSRTLVLKGSVSKEGDRLDLVPTASDQVIQSQTIIFPTALKLSAVETTGEARIEADWFASPLRKAREEAKKAPGDLRLPLAITTRYVAGDAAVSDTAVYQIGYGLEGRLLGGDAVKLKGLSLARRVDAKDAQKAVDAAWRR